MGDRAPLPSVEPATPPGALAEIVQRCAGDPDKLWSWIERVQETHAPAPRHGRALQLGSVHTPVGVARLMAQRLLRGRVRGARLRVLDAGCGTGRLLAATVREAAARGLQVACEGIELDVGAARWAQWLEPALRAAAPRTLLAWRIRHADFLLDQRPRARFDLAIANPPYVPLRDLEAGYRQQLAAGTLGAARGDLSLLFMMRLQQVLRPGGKACVIVPNKLLAAEYGTELRRRLLAEVRLEEIWDLAGARVFPGRATYPVILVYARRAPLARDAFTVFDTTGRERARWLQRDVLRLPRHVVPLELPAEALPLLRRLLAGPRFGERVPLACGIAKSGFQRAIGLGRERIICSGDIRPFRVRGRRRFSSQRAALAPRTLQRQKVPKVVIPGMFQRLHAAWDASGDLLGRVYYVPVNGPEPRERARLRALLLALLNSRLYAVLYRGFFGAVAQSGGYLRLNAPYLRALPWPERQAGARLLSTVRHLERVQDSQACARLDACVEDLFALSREERLLLARLDSRLYGRRQRRGRGGSSSRRRA